MLTLIPLRDTKASCPGLNAMMSPSTSRLTGRLTSWASRYVQCRDHEGEEGVYRSGYRDVGHWTSPTQPDRYSGEEDRRERHRLQLPSHNLKEYWESDMTEIRLRPFRWREQHSVQKVEINWKKIFLIQNYFNINGKEDKINSPKEELINITNQMQTFTRPTFTCQGRENASNWQVFISDPSK